MSYSEDDLKQFLEEKIAQCRKELEVYEYLLSLLETGQLKEAKIVRGISEVVKSPKGEIVADLLYSPPKMKVIMKKRVKVPKTLLNVLERILATSKNEDKIDYTINVEDDVLKEISISNVEDEMVYNKLKYSIKTVLERL